MARPPKEGLDYFPKDVDYYDDFKIMDLINKYGPLGQTIYDIIITMIFKNRYYLEVSLDNLARLVIRTIGNKWIKNKDLVLQVIDYCAEIGLFDKDLLAQNVITSVGVQRRYQKVTVRNKVNKEKYWLIDKDGQPLLNAPKIQVSATEIPDSVTETQVYDADIQQKERKENNTIYMSIVNYLNERCGTTYQNTAIETVPLILDKLSKGFTYEDFVKVINIKADEWLNTDYQKYLRPSTLFGKRFEEYLNQKPSVLGKANTGKGQSSKKQSVNKFNQFPQRNYSDNDYSTMEQRLLDKRSIG